MGGLLESDLPIVGAPMAGGPGTVRLAGAVAEAGGFPFLAAGYRESAGLADEIRELRSRLGEARRGGASGGESDGPGFGVNLFVPSAREIEPEVFRRYADELREEASALGVELPDRPVHDDDRWDEKLELLIADPVPVVSFTFGIPAPGEIAALQRAGTRVLVTVTSRAEALRAQEAGADGLVAQGSGAGGHRGTHDPGAAPSDAPAVELVRRVAPITRLPVIAAGGVDGPEAVAELLDAGAEAVAVGTLLLRTPEAGTGRTHREALADPRFTDTVVTRAFTGRYARALRNGFVGRHPAAPEGYPELHHLTRPLRRAAATAQDPDRLHLWAGTGFRAAEERPASEVVRRLAERLPA
ncbi:nitronate monooxygenase [Leucobacter sp. CSA1]|uniref:Propionate 3-nitronate monooxygenase n=1 Tax=Leucobacter chromiisoli TaxID=2796471 RepID=A0A934UU22_9MICO|nr:nitronate monooxygenase [Leucobacter chromiisoli]MBK0417951.1 nitronate monooxygenase [Leucobacter chromiisoli]